MHLLEYSMLVHGMAVILITHGCSIKYILRRERLNDFALYQELLILF